MSRAGILALALTVVVISTSTVSAQAPAWTVDPGAHEYTMSVTAALAAGSILITDEGDELCAYTDGEPECRGLAAAMEVGSATDAKRLFFLTIYGTEPAETIRFRAYDASQDRVREVSDSLGFSPNAVEGDPNSPMRLNVPYAVPLESGWNLIGYEHAEPQPVEEGLAELIDAGDLIYAVGYGPGGATLFDPNGLPVLNTLKVLEPGTGYWLKLRNPVDAFQFPAPGAAKAGVIAAASSRTVMPGFQFLQGMASAGRDGLTEHLSEGAVIEVLSSTGTVLASATVLHDGLIMTTPIYGTDGAPPGVSGLEIGEAVLFRYGGQTIDAAMTYQGNREPVLLNLTFDNVPTAAENESLPERLALEALWPNPTSGSFSLRFLAAPGRPVTAAVFDALGRRRTLVVDSGLAPGVRTLDVLASDWPPGIYLVVLSNGEERLVRPVTVIR